jgi:anti-anti-sigma factor
MNVLNEKTSGPKEPPTAAFIREDTSKGDILHVLGEVDLANADEFETAVLEISKGTGEVVVDLTACTYMDSSGLRVLASVHKAVENRLRVVIPKDGSVHRIFEITGLAEQFNACENVDAALRKQE